LHLNSHGHGEEAEAKAWPDLCSASLRFLNPQDDLRNHIVALTKHTRLTRDDACEILTSSRAIPSSADIDARLSFISRQGLLPAVRTPPPT
jgi:hypothetical protein